MTAAVRKKSKYVLNAKKSYVLVLHAAQKSRVAQDVSISAVLNQNAAQNLSAALNQNVAQHLSASHLANKGWL